MKWILRGAMLLYGMVGAYALPLIFMPWASEQLVSGLSVLIVFESLSLIGTYWLAIHVMREDVEAQQEDVTLDMTLKENTNVAAFKAFKAGPSLPDKRNR